MSELKLYARLPLGEDCYGNPEYADIYTTGGRSPGKDGLDEMKLWLDTVGSATVACNERQAHRAACFALEGMCRGLVIGWG